ncbi:MAG: hypothetical protein HY919_02880 [Elusimicrobia bacterium]|nr:hypothetical protein [Elusimicrobiota bacterium]
MENDEQKYNNWLDAMIEREALPREARLETVENFLKKWNVACSTYYYQASRKENQEKIVKLALSNAKKYAPEVLEGLGIRGIKDNKAAELYLKFILQLAERTDITSRDLPIAILQNVISSHNSNTKNNGAEKKD